MKKFFNYINLKIKTGSLTLYFLLVALVTLFLLSIAAYFFIDPEWVGVIVFGILSWPFFPFFGSFVVVYCYIALFLLVILFDTLLFFEKESDILTVFRYIIGYYIFISAMIISLFSLCVIFTSIF